MLFRMCVGLFVCLFFVNNMNEILYWSFSILLRKLALTASLDYISSQKRNVTITIQTEPVFILFFFLLFCLYLPAYHFNAAKNSICFWTRRIVWLLWKTNITYSYNTCSIWLLAMNYKNINLNILKSIYDVIFVPVLLILIRFACVSFHQF